MPERADVYQKALNEGHSAAWEQDWKKAAAEYRKALQEFPNKIKALNSLGLALCQIGEFDEALSTYQRVALLSPHDPVPLEKVAQISERVGDRKLAVETAMKAAEAFISERAVEKAIENWSRATALNPEQAVAHSRLAMVYERLGHDQQAVTEYLAVAGLLQRAGKADKAQEILTKALQLMPDSPDALQAQSLLKTGQLLPRPLRHDAGTEPVTMSQAVHPQEANEQINADLDPVAEAAQKALTKLADVLFNYGEEGAAAQQRGDFPAITKSSGAQSLQQAEQAKVVLHLGQAINAQARKEDSAAADELERALEAGFQHPALYFDIGYLRARGDRLESAVRNLARAVKDTDYGLGATLLLGEILFKKGQIKDAALEYLAALQLADSMTVPEGQSDEIRQLYEPLVETQQDQTDEDANRRLCENVRGLLMREDWREQIRRAREQARGGFDGVGAPAPLAEVMLDAQSSGVIGSMNRIHQLARAGTLRSAMDEAFDAVRHSPSYLPLHTLMGELLMQDSRTQDAIAKFSVVAHAYGLRGEVNQASRLLRRIIQLAPMNLSARNRLIDQLLARGQVDDAINEYLELADIFYRQAELEMARKTYATALHVVQQTNAHRSWSLKILQRMADIDMQRLDWKQAVRVFEQIRTLRPDDPGGRKQLVELYIRMGQEGHAASEIENFLRYLETNGRSNETLPFLEDLAKEYSDRPLFRRALAEQLHHLGQTDEAISQLDALGESLLRAGKNHDAAEVIEQILTMNPPRALDYRKLLAQIAK